MTFRDVPYRAQWQSPELIAEILAGARAAADDPQWAESGARTPVEYEFWSWRACGMACLKMALAYWGAAEPPLVQLAEEAEGYGAYVRKENSVQGLIYAPFTHYVHDRFGVFAETKTDLSITELVDAANDGAFVLASVNAAIRHPEAEPPRKGGHLVLVLGGDEQNVVFHNPSGDRADNQAFASVPRPDFARFFAARGVTLHPN